MLVNNCTIIIFGASGDLTRRKLIPALYNLICGGRISPALIVGASFDALTGDELCERAREFIKVADESVWSNFKKLFAYHKLDFNKYEDFESLHTLVKREEAERGASGQRMVYTATAASFFCTITDALARSRIVERKDEHDTTWHRIVYEKPFGKDLESALVINACIKKAFEEHQIYRIDHYLTKELVSNISLIRFTNCVFEPLWNREHIEEVQIIVSETIGVGDRAGYYDAYGALSDVVQNHMLELMALIAMESPEKLHGDFVRVERARVLEKTRFEDGFNGQYIGYRDASGVKPGSTTETFSLLHLMIDNDRWRGVPFYLKTGKMLAKRETVINIKFKAVDCPFTRSCPLESNWLTIRVAPEATFILTLNAKKPGKSNELVPIAMEFCHSCVYGQHETEAYETLLEEVMRGERSVSVRFDEIELSWKIIDVIRSRHIPLYFYEPGSQGPTQVETFEHKHDMRWRS